MAIPINHTLDLKTQSQSDGYSMNWKQRVLAVIFVISFALDFRGSAGGSLIQYCMAGINTTALLLLAISYRVVLPRRGLAAFIFMGWSAFLFVGTLSAIVNSTPFGHYLRIVYTFILFLEGFMVAWWAARDLHDAETIVAAMMASAVISLFFTFWWGFHFTGKDIGQIRYQILSPLIPLLIVVSGYDLFFARRRRLWAFFLLAVTLGLIMLSVTRTPILILIFVAGLIFLAAFRNVLYSGKVPRRLVWAVVCGLVFSVIALTVAIIFYPEVMARWVRRAFGMGHSTTFWMRVAAVVGQYQSLTEHFWGWLIGQGFGSSYSWPVSKFPWILEYTKNRIGLSVWFPGEFMWMSLLYYGGFIIGPIAALSLLAGAVRAFRSLGKLLKLQSWRIPQSRPLWVGVLGYFAFLGAAFTSNPFILRLASLYMGLCLGIVIAQSRFLLLKFMVQGEKKC